MFREFIRNTKRVRQTIKELEQLTDRELSDLGIYRCDIKKIAKQSVYG